MNNKYLLAIDNLDNELKSIVESIKNQGHQVDLNNNLDSILSSYTKGMYNVMVIEISSPGISELEFIKNVKAIDPLLQIIVISDYESEDAAKNALKYGAYHFLNKPICREAALSLFSNAIKYIEVKSENLKLKMNGLNSNGNHINENGEIDWSIDTMEKFHIIKVLKEHKWNISRSAQKLGIDRVTLYNKIKKYELRKTVN